MKISIIVPLLDRRNAGLQALTSALAQRYPRDGYEVVAVTGREASSTSDASLDALLARCDSVVRTGLDPAVAAHEIQLYLAGLRGCTGDLLFFCEGHTVLHDDCCALIERYFVRHPRCEIAWAPRLNHAASALGRLVAMHNDRHQRRAAAAGVFSLGANSVIRRSTFDALGGLDARYLRFSETALFHRALQRGTVVGHIESPLATHFNDMTEILWHQLAQDTGNGRYAYYDDLFASGQANGGRIRHPVYAYARRARIAALLAPVLRASGPILLRCAMRALPVGPRLAYRFYVLALACSDLAGYARAGAKRELRRSRQAIGAASERPDASAAAADQAFDARDDLARVGRPDALDQRLSQIGQEVS